MLNRLTPGLSPRRLAAVVLVGVAYYVAAVVSLALLEPDMSPLVRPISGYQKGRHPLLAATTFFALAATVAALALALRGVLRRGWFARAGLTLFWIAVAGIVIAGVFPYMPMHAVGALMTFPSLSLGSVFLSLAPGRAPRWDRARVPLVVLAVTICAMLATGVTLLSSLDLAGLAQRLYFALLFVWVWLTVVAVRIRTDPSVAGATFPGNLD